MFLSRAPRPPLDAVIESIWIVESGPSGPNRLERVLPTGAAQLIVNLTENQTRRYDPARGMRSETTGGVILAGPMSRFSVIDTREQEWVAGVAFKPGGATAFTRMPASEARDLDIDLVDLWPRDEAASLRERLLVAPTADARLDQLEAALRRAWRGHAGHDAVAYAVGTFTAQPEIASVSTVMAAIGLSQKRFIERFAAEVGLTPKRFCRVRRFQRAIALAHAGRAVDWTSVALDCGYYDQSHLIHDFREFSGLTPTEYTAARTPFQNHVNFLQDVLVAS
jgi:AraC-like DNA-binding protein